MNHTLAHARDFFPLEKVYEGPSGFYLSNPLSSAPSNLGTWYQIRMAEGGKGAGDMGWIFARPSDGCPVSFADLFQRPPPAPMDGDTEAIPVIIGLVLGGLLLRWLLKSRPSQPPILAGGARDYAFSSSDTPNSATDDDLPAIRDRRGVEGCADDAIGDDGNPGARSSHEVFSLKYSVRIVVEANKGVEGVKLQASYALTSGSAITDDDGWAHFAKSIWVAQSVDVTLYIGRDQEEEFTASDGETFSFTLKG